MIDLLADTTPAPARPVWLMTLADLALLLVGFFVLLQANQSLDRNALARGLAEGFGVAAPPPLAVEARAVRGFAAGSAELTVLPDDIVGWALSATSDPRVALTLTGTTDGSMADTDPATRSAAVLAADRARAVAAALAELGVPIARATIATNPAPTRAGVVITLAFVGEEGKKP